MESASRRAGPIRRSAAPLLALALMSAACGGAPETNPEPTAAIQGRPAATSPPVAPSTSATTTVAATTATASATTTVVAGTTTAALPPESWHVPGRRYYFPVQPSAATAYGAAHHDYPATDIFAPVGTALVAVTDGVVDELRRTDPYDPAVRDPATLGGRYVSIVGDDGVRYYCSHLAWVAEGLEAGDRVEAGQRLGAIGISGDAATTPPHCHFGISRPTSPGDWEIRRGEVWPFDYLQAWQRGDEATPVLPGP